MAEQAGMDDDLSLASSMPGWSDRSKTEFLSALLKVSKDIKKEEVNSMIAALHRQKKKDNSSQIALLEKELSLLHERTLTEVALPLDQEYDWEELSNILSERHTAQECQYFWKSVLHPTINKSNWTKIEHGKLQKLNGEFDMQEWNMIAKMLNTGRTGYQCFLYYCRIKAPSHSEQTPEEDQHLHKVVDYFKAI